METTEVKTAEVVEVFHLLEELNALLHRREVLEDPKLIRDALQGGLYQRLRHGYYDVVWNWLPRNVQEEIEARL